MEHFGIAGFHAGSLAGGEDHDMDVRHMCIRHASAQVGPGEAWYGTDRVERKGYLATGLRTNGGAKASLRSGHWRRAFGRGGLERRPERRRLAHRIELRILARDRAILR